MLRREFLPKKQLSPTYLNNLRTGGEPCAGILDSLLDDPRAAFLEEWDQKVRHKKLWRHFGSDLPYDARRASEIKEVEGRAGVAIPIALKDFMTRESADIVLMHWSPSNNIPLSADRWRVQQAPHGYRVLRVIEMVQHACSWYVAWQANEATFDPPVFVVDAFDDEQDTIEDFFELAQCTANHWSEFLFDYAIEGDRWYQENLIPHPSREIMQESSPIRAHLPARDGREEP